MAKIGKALSHEQAAEIIGRHFPEISDKLLNILQLKKGAEGNSSKNLIEASINQKAEQIAIVPISRAVDLSKNKKYLPFLLPLVLVGVFILVAAPKCFQRGFRTFIAPTKALKNRLHFKFIFRMSNCWQYVTVICFKAVVKGNALPAMLSIEIGKDLVPMTALDNHIFQYTFKNVTEPVNFRLSALVLF